MDQDGDSEVVRNVGKLASTNTISSPKNGKRLVSAKDTQNNVRETSLKEA
jgi:hypothetical protein